MIRTVASIVAQLRDGYGSADGRTAADLIERLADERDQALIRAEAAEAELEAYRRAERKVS